jgi:predicted small metal-binding protein
MGEKVIHCRDVGFDCEGVVRADSEEEVVALAAQHAAEVHGVTELTPEIVEAVKGAIRDEE